MSRPNALAWHYDIPANRGRKMANLLNCLKTALSDVAMGWGVSPDYHALAGMRSALATDLVAEFRQELTDRYVVEDEIGRGGMALVFLATDRRHDRKVALKVLRPERAFQVGRERFLREIRLAAQLAHPHILPVYDSGEAAGLLYFVMPHVEGGSLRERLQREHRLSLEDASQITHDVAGALDYAHRHHVVHRDIKPENVMLQDGVAMVADFGIGKAFSAAGAQHLTGVGSVVGTPAYMSPEQMFGEGDIDGRSDIYSLGCVLYEMLTGEPLFTGPTHRAVLARRITNSLPDLAFPDTVPDEVRATIRAALAEAPEERPVTGAQIVCALEHSMACHCL